MTSRDVRNATRRIHESTKLDRDEAAHVLRLIAEQGTWRYGTNTMPGRANARQRNIAEAAIILVKPQPGDLDENWRRPYLQAADDLVCR
jgi:hypothetical protein